MLKLIGSPKTRAFRVLWMLEELGYDYRLDASGPHSEAVTALNPSGKVPVLVHDDVVVPDSVAAIQYLADHAGRLTAPAGSKGRAEQDSFTFFACDELDGSLWQASKHSFLWPEDKRIAGVPETCGREFGRALKTLEARIGERAYVCGDAFTVPDLLIVHCAGWAGRLGWAWRDGPLTAYVERVRARPAFVKASEIREAA